MKTQNQKQEKIKIEIKLAEPKQETERFGFVIEKVVPNCEEF